MLQVQEEKLDMTNVDERLKHLTQKEIASLINRYYAKEKIETLLVEYKVDVTPSMILKTFPPVIVEECCDVCGGTLIANLQSKTKGTLSLSYCRDCGHVPSKFRCECENCKEERKQILKEKKEAIAKEKRQKREEARKQKQTEIDRARELAPEVKLVKKSDESESPKQVNTSSTQERKNNDTEKKREIIMNAIHPTRYPKVLEWNLTQEDRLYLAAILRAGLSEDLTIIEPLNKIERKVAPTNNLLIEMYRALLHKNIIIVSVTSKLDDFFINENSEGEYDVQYDITKVKYQLNIVPEDGFEDKMIRRLTYPEPELFDNDFCYEMWRKVGLAEAEEYLLYEMKKVGYDFNPGAKTHQVLERLLDHYSVGQVYGFIYRGVSFSTRKYQEGNITRRHAQNMVITSCEKCGERALAENWKIVNYSRRAEVKQTVISEVLFDSIMRISTLGFTEVPTSNY